MYKAFELLTPTLFNTIENGDVLLNTIMFRGLLYFKVFSYISVSKQGLQYTKQPVVKAGGGTYSSK